MKLAHRAAQTLLLSTAGLALAAAVPLAARGPTQGAEPPGRREVDDLVEEYVELEGRSAADLARQDAILARLALVEPLREHGARTWRKKLLKLWERGPELEQKSGRRFLDEKTERGLYIVGGETRRPKGLFVGMHGGGLGSGDAWTSHGTFNHAASANDWLAVFPQVLEKTELGWTTSGTEEFVMELVERARRTWDVDPDRVYFGGHSMGGYGTWTLGAHHADRVAALTPSAGAPTPIREGPGGEVLDIVPGVVPNLRNVAMVIYQSDDDVDVPPDANRMAVQRLGEARERWGGFDFEYWEVPGRGHSAPPGGAKALLAKVADRERDARPERVVWQPALAWKRQMYWLWWDAPPVERALVVADLDREANAVRVTCEEGSAAGLRVLLDDELLDLDREVLVELDGAEVFRGRVERELAPLVATGAHGDPALTYAAWIPVGREPAEGAPIEAGGEGR